MRLVHSIRLRVHSKEQDNEEQITDSLLSLVPFDLEKEKLKLEKTVVEGFEHKKIEVVELALVKERHTKAFLENFIEKINTEDKKTIFTQIDSRLDDNLDFFLRFDKSALLNENKLRLTDSGDCFHIKMSIAAFPAKKEKAIDILNQIFK